jgi:hypothetical protein
MLADPEGSRSALVTSLRGDRGERTFGFFLLRRSPDYPRDSGTSVTRVTPAARRQSIPRSVMSRLTPAVDSTSRGRGAAC